MKLKYLGTAAAEGIPSLFCDCENCKRSLELGGYNIRTRSQALIDNTIIIDFPCDSYIHAVQNHINFSKTKYCLVTHNHQDHFYPEEFSFIKKGFAVPSKDWSLCIYGSSDIQNDIGKIIPYTGDFLKYKQIEPFQPFQIEKYTITALKAHHGTEHPYIYSISDGCKSILYAHDTDIFQQDTWDYLCRIKPYYNMISMDCTHATYHNLEWHGHMSLERNIELKAKMTECGFIDKDTAIVLNHFSHNGPNCLYDDFLPYAKKDGLIVSYDGMEITI